MSSDQREKHYLLCVCIYIYTEREREREREFTTGQEDPDSIPCRVISKTQKMGLRTCLLNIQHYKVWVKGKWSNPGKGVVPSHTLQCSSNCKESSLVAHDNDRPTYLYIITTAISETVIVLRNETSDPISNPDRIRLHFTSP